MAQTCESNIYINDDGFNVLVKACNLVSAQFLDLAQLYYRPVHSNMTSSGSQSFVRGRGGFQPPKNRVDESHGEKEIFRLTPDDYEKTVSYLEVPENFATILGGGRRQIVGKKYGSKMVVFKSMLVTIQHHGFPEQITAANLQKRFQRYVKKYKDAREFKLDTGGVLTDEEIAAGIFLKDKLERICPHFERIHALYGERPNVAPAVLGDVGIDENDIIQQEDGESDGDLDEDLHSENVNPNCDVEYAPTEFREDGTPCTRSPPPLAETHATLQNHRVEAAFWTEMEEMVTHAQNTAPVHSISCQCNDCRKFSRVHTGESRPQPTELLHNTQPPSATRSMSSNGPSAAPTPTKKTKSPVAAAKDAAANSKPTFTSIYVDRISQKADYRRELIQSRDKWKAQDLQERRQARLEVQAEECKKGRLERKHQLALETAIAENALKKARLEFEHAVEISISKMKAEQDHQRDMAKTARKTTLLTTLFGSSKSPAEIKDLLPIIDETE